jgi:hypothetical protein
MSQQKKTGYTNSQFVQPKQKNYATYTPTHNVAGSSTSMSEDDWIIPGPAGILQRAILRKNADIREGGPEYCVVPTQDYIAKVNEDVTEDEHFTSGPWLSAIDKVFNSQGVIVTGCFGDIKKHCVKGKIELVVAVIKSCTPNMLGDLNCTLKDPTGTMAGTIHHKVLAKELPNKKYLKVGAVLVLRNVSVFTSKSSPPALNITKRNLVEVIDKNTVFGG